MRRETTWKDRVYLFIGTCFGLGYAPILPGTCRAKRLVLFGISTATE